LCSEGQNPLLPVGGTCSGSVYLIPRIFFFGGIVLNKHSHRSTSIRLKFARYLVFLSTKKGADSSLRPLREFSKTEYRDFLLLSWYVARFVWKGCLLLPPAIFRSSADGIPRPLPLFLFRVLIFFWRVFFPDSPRICAFWMKCASPFTEGLPFFFCSASCFSPFPCLRSSATIS